MANLVSIFFNKTYEYKVNKLLMTNEPLEESSFPRESVISYVKDVCSVPYIDFLDYLKEHPSSLSFDSSNITQCSRFENCTTRFCRVYKDINYSRGLDTKELGDLLQSGASHSSEEGSLRRYGRDQSSAAKQLGLADNIGHLWFVTCIGVVFLDLSQVLQQGIMARALLRDPYYSRLVFHALNEDVVLKNWMQDLGSSSINRRINYVSNFLKIIIAEAPTGTFHNIIK